MYVIVIFAFEITHVLFRDVLEQTRYQRDTDTMHITEEGSQTQPETQLVPDSQDDDSNELKRKLEILEDQEGCKSKKVKISIGPAVDLGD